MKNYFITLSILLFCSSIVCAYSSYTYPNQMYPYKPYRSKINSPYAYKINPFAPDPFMNVRYENSLQQKLKLIRQIIRLRNHYNAALLSWSPFTRNNNNGSLTGYSVPINQDIYNNLGTSPKKQRGNSPTCNTDLFTLPSNDNYLDDGLGHRKKGNDGVGAKTGVTIIYD